VIDSVEQSVMGLLPLFDTNKDKVATLSYGDIAVHRKYGFIGDKGFTVVAATVCYRPA
jgi:hypothetical protein